MQGDAGAERATLELRLKQAEELLTLLYVEGVDDSEGDCLYCRSEGYCLSDCVMEEVADFLGIEVPDEMQGGPQKRYRYVYPEEYPEEDD